MKKVFLLSLVIILVLIPVLSSCSSTTTSTSTPVSTPTSSAPVPSTALPTSTSVPTPPASTPATTPPTSQPPTTSTSAIITGGTLILSGMQLPKNIGYQPTMSQIDKHGLFQGGIAERLMDLNDKGELVPELATSVDTDPAARTITWHLRQGVQFQDGTPFNAQAAAWNFQQLNDVGTLQYGDQIAGMEVMDNYTLRFRLKNFSYSYLQSFSYNVFMLSPTAIEKNGKDWAITHVYGTGPFMVKTFDPTSKFVLVKNPNYWRPGLPYLDGLELDNNLDSAVLSAQMQSNEIQIQMGGDLVLQKDLVAKGFKLVYATPTQTVDFMVPSSNDPNSPLSNPLVREAIQYAIDLNAICNGYLQGTATAMDQMAYKGAPGYGPANARTYDPNKAKQLLEQAGYPGGKGISISIYGSNSAPSTGRRTAIAGYLQQVGIDAKVVSLPFASYATMQAQGWNNGYMDCVENSGAIWSTAFLNWLGPLPTANPIPSLARSDAYNTLADQVLTAPDAATQNSIVAQLVKMVNDDSMVLPLWSQPNTWNTQPFVHTEDAATPDRSFDWAKVWTEKP